ncbi:hypothetical protein HMPREF1529_02675 [Microbacterium sp. oral taxon 186 str. F0373]|uniref:hypothetical protein n=1 Tax=unclassified Microbacterium TaxID=2609290 RepID=UPI00034EC4C0|nr:MULTISPECIES: hypothetical protein [unclassified Microbacterium]EPD83299.1 hypothetical protein HMPREF1529_02675 [Microbacterium sp. oral taxon 186 str. F0373]RKS84838.1 hypothetical protein DEU37_2895 [Microbacterium sp. AG790]
MITFTRYPYTGPIDQLDVPSIDAPWTSARESRTIEHQLLESSKTLYTLRPPRPSAGAMTLRFPDAASAHAARDFFSTAAEFDMYPVDPPELSARFVVTGGDIAITQETGSWTLTLPWREVIA